MTNLSFTQLTKVTSRSALRLTKGTKDPVAFAQLEDAKAYKKYKSRTRVEPELNRQLVSFQANKTVGLHRWYKFKEGFSSELVKWLLKRSETPVDANVLDPFSGSGTTIVSASDLGLRSTGIELLPVGLEATNAKLLATSASNFTEIGSQLRTWALTKPWHSEAPAAVPYFAITFGAYPPDTEAAIGRYTVAFEKESGALKEILRFALLCVVERVSYTSKDGQCLRWDGRATKHLSKPGAFRKKNIEFFDDAIATKLLQIADDLAAFTGSSRRSEAPTLISGSCLNILPTMAAGSIGSVVTSPPYCNRYDYTRTYALELALLGVSEPRLKELRQTMLTCTTENRAKDLLLLNPTWERAVSIADNNALLQSTLAALEHLKIEKKLNNNGVPRMVRSYFYEMACAIQELARVCRTGAMVHIVNDNVRYGEVSVSVDLILCEVAESLGFSCKEILVLPQSKGNSPQQMGEFGRQPLRKCVYVWEKL